MNLIKINEERYIGENQPVFIIAEAGINHNGDIKIAKKMIDSAKKCGVDAVKFQTFKAEEFISDRDEVYVYKSQGKEITESMYEMFKRYEFNEKEWIDIANYCKEKDIIFFSTPQNPSDLDFLLSIVDMPIIKVGADDLTNLELLKYYASKGKPMIISAGMAYISEIEEASETIRGESNNDLAILHCISSYPADAEEVNLRKMNTIKNAFDAIVGFSDHTMGNEAAVMAVTLGAKIIEKHFTLDKNMAGPDHWFSADIDEMKKLVYSIRFAEKAMGSSRVKPTEKEMEMRRIARRSIIAKKDLLAGHIIDKNDIEFKRPGEGLPPKFAQYLIGKKITKTVRSKEIINFENI
ncbi:N-acetylneuraminate synthase family protein [Clostridium paridis]|uniref:N-acetylneuraminate synthase family protein n=1 Tax=Clostridium paridis TaxID=2803863 RepID=A0A937FKH3_9CLOT|nr:N-acetylneuraminate synthase family protein [Clostridium paridis]MBL4933546.1 N-acetylneuraminate synthase family protein [Clostridium paridis]